MPDFSEKYVPETLCRGGEVEQLVLSKFIEIAADDDIPPEEILPSLATYATGVASGAYVAATQIALTPSLN